MKTTLKRIKNFNPIFSINDFGISDFIAKYQKSLSDDTPLDFLDIMEYVGLDDALWCLRTVDIDEDAVRNLAIDFMLLVIDDKTPDFVKEYLETKNQDLATSVWNTILDDVPYLRTAEAGAIYSISRCHPCQAALDAFRASSYITTRKIINSDKNKLIIDADSNNDLYSEAHAAVKTLISKQETMFR